MAYEVPDALDFKQRFPAFGCVADATITAAIAETGSFVDETWMEEDYATAILYLAAHFLYQEGALAGSEAGGPGMTSGPVRRVKVGDVETEFAAPAQGSSGDQDLMSTVWGKRFLDLRKRNVPAVLVIDR